MKKSTDLIIKVASSFCLAAVFAGVITYTVKKEKPSKTSTTDGIGGLEISAVPQYDNKTQEEFVNEILNQDTLSLDDATSLAKDDLATLENAEKKEIGDDLYYTSYRIRKGDMIGVIAEKYGVSQDTLISVNKIRATRSIQIGQNIKIPSLDGILYSVKKDGETAESIAEKYEVPVDHVSKVNKIAHTASLSAGQSIFVPGAELDWITRQEINGDLFRKPIRGYYRISSYYGWRPSPFSGRRQFHGGIDMACGRGTPIYAAMEGTIVVRGWSNVYGNYIIVQHHSGYRTLYGHMSAFSKKFVKGSYVRTSDVIGYVGSTGQSTGPHVHFTVFKNGRMVNPYNLWG